MNDQHSSTGALVTFNRLCKQHGARSTCCSSSACRRVVDAGSGTAGGGAAAAAARAAAGPCLLAFLPLSTCRLFCRQALLLAGPATRVHDLTRVLVACVVDGCAVWMGWMGLAQLESPNQPSCCTVHAPCRHPAGAAPMAWLAANALPAATLPAAAAHPAASQLTAGTVRLARSLKRLRVCAAGAELCGCAAAACKAGASAELRHEDAARAETGRMPPRLPAPVAATACRAGSFSPSAFSPTAWLPQRRREETVMAAGAVLPAQRAELEAARRPSAACCNMMMVAAVAGG